MSAGPTREDSGTRRAVFLDRDGVLNRANVVDGIPHPPASVAELELLPGVDDACRRLHDAGLLLIVVTNQPDVARGTQTLEAVEALNRANVVDGIPHPPASVAELELLPGVDDACRRLHDAGLLLIVVTNQPDVARGTQTLEAVEALNRELGARLPLDEFRVCPHDDADACDCRKPAPGMLLDAASEHGIELAKSVMVGDRWRDVEAGKRAGCKTVFVAAGYSERPPDAPDLTVRDLGEAVPWILDLTVEGHSENADSR